MLRTLSIKDFAIIDELDVELGPGLLAMTGETGAGKTIVVEALKLVLGARASTDIIRSGRERATVTAAFTADRLPGDVAAAISDAGIECDGEIIVHRVVDAQGRGRISINGVPSTVAMLRRISPHLVDISSQHENQLLLDGATHAPMLDEFAGLAALHGGYLEAHRLWSEASRELAELEGHEREAREKLDYLKFQLSELDAADVRPGEFEELEAKRSRMKHSVLLREKVSGAESAIAGEGESAIGLIGNAAQLVGQCAEYEPRAAAWCEALSRARIELEEAGRELSSYLEGLGCDPSELEAIEDRIHLIKGLMRKHGGSAEAVIARREDLAREVRMVENYDGVLEEKRGALAEISRERSKAARALSGARAKAAKEMGGRVMAELGDLGMAKAHLVVMVEMRPEGEWDESGPDRVELLISPNVGEELRPLARIASGGELSRIMLAIKGAVAGSREIASTSVFDEVDSGIGGGVASVVGRKLKELAGSRQVICITHLPQVAAFADSHLRISKRVKGGRTVASLDPLDADGRVSEIARMLGGEKVTDVAVKHAREMLRESNGEL